RSRFCLFLGEPDGSPFFVSTSILSNSYFCFPQPLDAPEAEAVDMPVSNAVGHYSAQHIVV
ncbi:hypothetical protein NDI52_25805, partial [Leptolyngbya sp. PL-A3]|uniref:hypothetical protein n=1 Tax=Leptolyngbya sp. PL-A3 TaxID=2933911 RepID=UPI00329A2264